MAQFNEEYMSDNFHNGHLLIVYALTFRDLIFLLALGRENPISNLGFDEVRKCGRDRQRAAKPSDQSGCTVAVLWNIIVFY